MDVGLYVDCQIHALRSGRAGIPRETPPSMQMTVDGPLVTLRGKRPPRLVAATTVELDDEVRALIAADAPCAVGVSGGKDSCAAAIAVVEHLRAVGHKGPVVLVHADLGDSDPALNVEWDDSLPTCERLAAFLKVPLIVTRRAAGGMMKRWQKRWDNNVKRYADLSCVKIILPWSTPSMRFCTSELKSAPIASELVRRFPGQRIISACGIRREEGKGRKESARTNAPTSKENKRLTNKRASTSGVDWNPIAAWSTSDVFAICAARGFQMHEGYALGMSRISCRFCIMQDTSDQRVSASVAANAPVLRTIVGLEIKSTFAFQGSRWLGDVAPELLDDATRAAIVAAKDRAAKRVQIEKRIPKHLLYTKGWPTVMPTQEEAELLCAVRREVAELLGIKVSCTEPAKLIARYAELMAKKAAKEAAKAARTKKRAGAAS
jgi:3'-phosphoadenosine 5'-phosphosulfate sulfotransferase (PAPS reductase)/FAD synthetase